MTEAAAEEQVYLLLGSVEDAAALLPARQCRIDLIYFTVFEWDIEAHAATIARATAE